MVLILTRILLFLFSLAQDNVRIQVLILTGFYFIKQVFGQSKNLNSNLILNFLYKVTVQYCTGTGTRTCLLFANYYVPGTGYCTV